MSRECDNWLDTFVDLYKDTSPAPFSFLEWSGMFCLSSVVKRRIEFSREYLKTYRIYPNIYVIFVAPPGEALKSTTAGLGVEVIAELNKLVQINHPAYVKIGQSSGSHIGIVQDLAESLDASVSIIAGEFGTLASYTPVETYDFLSHMFDADKIAEKYTHKTRKKGVESITKPSVNILGCTTPSWMTENAGYITGGGFAARVVFVFESKRRYWRLFSKGVGYTVKEQEEIKKMLAEDLKKIGNLKGEARPENKELADEMDRGWFQKRKENFQGDKGTETFQARKHVHALRNAMLLSISERDDLIITRTHWEKSLEQIKQIERGLGRGMAVLGRNPYSGLLYEILEYIQDVGPVDRGRVMARFWQDFQSHPDQDLGMILEVLKATGEVEKVTIGLKEEWRATK